MLHIILKLWSSKTNLLQTLSNIHTYFIQKRNNEGYRANCFDATTSTYFTKCDKRGGISVRENLQQNVQIIHKEKKDNARHYIKMIIKSVAKSYWITCYYFGSYFYIKTSALGKYPELTFLSILRDSVVNLQQFHLFFFIIFFEGSRNSVHDYFQLDFSLCQEFHNIFHKKIRYSSLFCL